MHPIRKHYVEFLSPGTFFSQQSRRPIDKWDTAVAVELANGIQERHGAKPYGFRFTTMLEAEPLPDGEGGMLAVTPKEVAKSGLHYLGGDVKLYDDIPDNEQNRILRSNMSGNRHPIVIENRNSWRHVGFFEADECIVDASGAIVRRGNDPDLAAYRQRKNAEFQAETDRWWAEHQATQAAVAVLRREG